MKKYYIALPLFQNGVKSGFEMCFAIGSQHLWCQGKTRFDSRINMFKPHLIHRSELETAQEFIAHLQQVVELPLHQNGANNILHPNTLSW